jgi:Derlin-2/3
MDQMMGGGEGGLGGQAGFPLEAWFWEMPVCTRLWTTATVVTSILVQCDIVTPLKLFYSFNAVVYKNQVRCRILAATPLPQHPTILQ